MSGAVRRPAASFLEKEVAMDLAVEAICTRPPCDWGPALTAPSRRWREQRVDSHGGALRPDGHSLKNCMARHITSMTVSEIE